MRPRNAVCPACGYVQGGKAIREGVVTCSECGTPIRFELVTPVRSRRARAVHGGVRVVLLLVALALVGAVFAKHGWLLGLIAAGALVVGLVIMRGARALHDYASGD